MKSIGLTNGNLCGLVLLSVVSLGLSPVNAAEPVSGAPLKVGRANGVGPLAAPKLNNLPIGVAHVYGKEMPDLFVIGGSRFYPELVIFPWREWGANGVPVFDPPVLVTTPDYLPSGNYGTVFEVDGNIHALWIVGDALVLLNFDRTTLAFHESSRIPVPKTPRRARTVGWLPDGNGSGFRLFYDVNDGTGHGPPMEGFTSSRDPRYDPYDGAGIWRGKLSHAGLYMTHHVRLLDAPDGEPVLASATPSDVLQDYQSLTSVVLGTDGQPGIIGGSHFGPFYYYEVNQGANPALEPYRFLVDGDGIVIRHPTVRATPVAYPDPQGHPCNLLAGGEGAIYFYRFLGRFTDSGQPVYAKPTPALQRGADLFGGTLLVPNVVDWDGDGALDIVSGNSEGLVLYFRNGGDNHEPAFEPGVPLKANSEIIHVQPGYSDSIQGPVEARWGYTCPTVADWNDDGLYDIVMSDATAQHRVFLNEGSPANPRLAAPHSIYLEGLELHGSWRVKPAIAKLAGRMAYVALDDDDEFHLYWQLDPFNVEDGGKLHLDTGPVIGANFLKSGGTGRLKLSFVDWDADGKTDLLVGTPRHGSVPDPEHGLPQALGLPGSGVLLLRNTGSDKEPVFAYPELIHFRGKPVFFGQHACGPTLAALGRGDRPGIVVGMETGRFIFLDRADIDFAQVPVPAQPGE